MTRGFLSEGSSRDKRADEEMETVDVILKRDLELSWGVYEPTRHGEMIWLPKSLVALVGGEQPACKARVSGPRWLLEKKGLL